MLIKHSSPPEIAYTRYKDLREDAVSKIVVTISDGLMFDGDEASQNRMARVMAVSSKKTKTWWKLADNSVQEVTTKQLQEALELAGLEQTRLWMGGNAQPS